MLQELLDELSVPVDRAIMVGDTEYDLEMARALGMPRVGVSYGVHTPERLAASQPEKLCIVSMNCFRGYKHEWPSYCQEWMNRGTDEL